MWTKAPCESGACVEVLELRQVVHVRDSTDQEGPVLIFTKQEWAVFVQAVKQGTFDLR